MDDELIDSLEAYFEKMAILAVLALILARVL